MKFLEKKEAKVIDEDPFPLVASINIAATDLRAVLNAKKDGRFSPNSTIRKLWIPNQYLVHRDELEAKRRVSIVKKKKKENNGRYPYHSKQEIKKEKSSKKRMFLQKRDILFQGERAFTLQEGKYLQDWLPLLLSHLDKSGICMHKKFPQKLIRTKKNKDVEIENYGQKATLLEEMPQGKPKETMREEVMPTLKKTKIGRKVIKPDLYIDQIY